MPFCQFTGSTYIDWIREISAIFFGLQTENENVQCFSKRMNQSQHLFEHFEQLCVHFLIILLQNVYSRLVNKMVLFNKKYISYAMLNLMMMKSVSMIKQHISSVKLENTD